MALTMIIAALAGCGLLLIAWTIFEAMLFPMPGEDAVLILPLSGDAAAAQQQIRACRWLREHRGLRARVILVDRGLTPEAQNAVEQMIRGEQAEVLCAETQVMEYLGLEKEYIGTGTDQRHDCCGGL